MTKYETLYVPEDMEGIVEMMLNATQNYKRPIDEERLFGWHTALFPYPLYAIYFSSLN